MLNKLYEQRIYNSIAQARLEDVMALSERYGKLNKRKRETCFFVTLFARLAGYSKPAALELTELVNLRYRKPLHRWQLMSAIRSAEACFEENGVIYYYSNARLVRELDIRGEKYLQLKAIMSDKERKRRKAIKDRASYARRRGGPSKKDKIKSRLYAMARKLLNGTLDRKAFQRENGIGRSTYYADLCKARDIAARLLFLALRLALHAEKTCVRRGFKRLLKRVFRAVSAVGYMPLLALSYRLKAWARPPNSLPMNC